MNLFDKMFVTVMTSNIESHMDLLHCWCDTQCGFEKDHRAEDNSFIFFKIMSKYIYIVSYQKLPCYLALTQCALYYGNQRR